MISWKIRKALSTVVGSFANTKTKRRRLRDKIRFHNFILSTGGHDFPIEKHPNKINIAFCCNGAGVNLATVSIISLIESAKGRCDYHIYCVIDDSVTKQQIQNLTRLVKNSGSQMTFLDANHDFDKSQRRRWPVAIFYRLMLPKLLPNVDKIIYADIDIIFCRDLIELSIIDMGQNMLAGVKDYSSGYINSGFLVMNLKQIRKEKIYDKWISLTQKNDYRNPDQDLLNITCKGKIIFLPVKYNFQSMLGNDIFKTNSEKALSDLRHNLVIMHYSNWMKPWHEEDKRPMFSDLWWQYAKQTGLY